MVETIEVILTCARICIPLIKPLQDIILLYAMSRGDILLHQHLSHEILFSDCDFARINSRGYIVIGNFADGCASEVLIVGINDFTSAEIIQHVEAKNQNAFRDHFHSIADKYALLLIARR